MKLEKRRNKTMKWISIISGAVSILVALFIFAVLTGKKVPLISGDKAAFIILFILGFSMSVLAGIRDAENFQQMIPLVMISLMVLGALAVLLFIVTLIGIKVPLISGYRRAFVAMATIIASKWAISIYTT
jgi:predicted membrane protein